MIFVDFEVFKYDWLAVFADTETEEFTVIVNDNDQLREFYENHVDDLYCGYNIRGYDSYIYKGLLLDFDPYDISSFIIEKRQKGWMYSGAFRKIKLHCFDIMTSFHSLKQLEGFMGNDIKESSVSFTLDRKLTEKEIQETIQYCRHDVEQTIEVFLRRQHEFDSHMGLIKEFNLPLSYIEKTKPQLSAIILGAKREKREDEWAFSIPGTLQLDKYKHIEEWYRDSDNHQYEKTLSIDVAEVPFEFAWGGIHGAIPNYIGEGIYVACDVASLYPALMIEYDYQSRNISDKSKFKEIRDRRLELKAKKDPTQAPLKIVLNSTYGAMKDKYNALYDPLMANNVCVAGQLLILDLIEKLEPYGQIIQANTDGVFIKVDKVEQIKKLKKIAVEWEVRTRLDLEWEQFTNIWQKDVNNYITYDKTTDKMKSKGAYVKSLNELDNDLSIVNKAVVNFFVYGIEPEKTIGKCNNLIEFQKISKIGTPYAFGMYGDEVIKERVIRTFASRSRKDRGAFKVKIVNGEERPAKIENTPERCRIINENIVGKPVPAFLDKQWYIDMARKRITDFMGLER